MTINETNLDVLDLSITEACMYLDEQLEETDLIERIKIIVTVIDNGSERRVVIWPPEAS